MFWVLWNLLMEEREGRRKSRKKKKRKGEKLPPFWQNAWGARELFLIKWWNQVLVGTEIPEKVISAPECWTEDRPTTIILPLKAILLSFLSTPHRNKQGKPRAGRKVSMAWVELSSVWNRTGIQDIPLKAHESLSHEHSL